MVVCEAASWTSIAMVPHPRQSRPAARNAWHARGGLQLVSDSARAHLDRCLAPKRLLQLPRREFGALFNNLRLDLRSVRRGQVLLLTCADRHDCYPIACHQWLAGLADRNGLKHLPKRRRVDVIQANIP